MSYLNTESIKVFPAARRSLSTTSARQMTEYNISGIVNKLINLDSFVSFPIYSESDSVRPAYCVVKDSDGNYSGNLIFNISGYNFSAKFGDLLDLGFANNNIYANISIDTASTSTYNELIGTDSVDSGSDYSTYKGVSFTAVKPSDTEFVGDDYRGFKRGTNITEFYLKILQEDENGELEIPKESLARFTSDVIDIIDGGII